MLYLRNSDEQNQYLCDGCYEKNTTYELFIKLVRIGIGTEIVSNLKPQVPGLKEWVLLKALADEHGLTAIVLDALNTNSYTNSCQVSTKLTDAMPQQMKLERIGEVMQSESTYKLKQEVATDMALLFHRNAMRTYVLKGAVIAECYPKPNHRTSVDMDCFLLSAAGNFDAWELGISLIESMRLDVFSIGYYKNSTFYISGLVVENHQFITPFRGNKRLSALEKLLQSLIKEDNGGLFKGTYLYRPPIMVSALFIIEHAYNQFLSEGLTWEHILDWQMFSKKHQKEIDWSTFHGFVDEFGFRKFYDAFLRLGHYLMG